MQILSPKYYLVFFVLFVLLTGFIAPKFKSVNLTKDISILLPQDFVEMPLDAIAAKYPSPRKPVAAYTSSNGQVDFILTERPSMFHENDLKMVQDFYKASINNKYSEVKFIRNEIKKIKNQEFVLFEFTSTVRDEGNQTKKFAPIRRYTIVQYTITNKKLMIFTFNVPIDLMAGWQENAQKVMQSVKVNG